LHKQNQTGAIAEEIAALHFLREGYYVFKPVLGFGPVDLIAIRATGEMLFADVKSENKRQLAGRKLPSLIHRPRTAIQKLLNVTMVYVNIDDETVHIVDHAAN